MKIKYVCNNNAKELHSQRVVVDLDLREVLPRPHVARVVEGADEALREGQQSGRRHRLLVEEALKDKGTPHQSGHSSHFFLSKHYYNFLLDPYL